MLYGKHSESFALIKESLLDGFPSVNFDIEMHIFYLVTFGADSYTTLQPVVFAFKSLRSGLLEKKLSSKY